MIISESDYRRIELIVSGIENEVVQIRETDKFNPGSATVYLTKQEIYSMAHKLRDTYESLETMERNSEGDRL